MLCKNKFRTLITSIALSLCGSAALATPTNINPFVPQNTYATYAALAADATMTAADTTNGDATTSTGQELLIAYNTDSASHTVTVTSAPDYLGRSLDITSYAIAATTMSIFGPFPVAGWKQASDSKIHYTSNSALVKFVVVRLPN